MPQRPLVLLAGRGVTVRQNSDGKIHIVTFASLELCVGYLPMSVKRNRRQERQEEEDVVNEAD